MKNRALASNSLQTGGAEKLVVGKGQNRYNRQVPRHSIQEFPGVALIEAVCDQVGQTLVGLEIGQPILEHETGF